MSATYAIGVDFGGTKLLAGVVDVTTGQVLATGKKKSRRADSPAELVARIGAVVDEAIAAAGLGKKTPFAGLCVGLAGQVDAANGILLGSPSIAPSALNLPLGALLQERYGIPARIRNDVHIAATGEARFGAGVGAESFVCVFVGTGIGGAFVLNGEVVKGATGTAGEIGHLVVDANGRLCGCGGRGHLEAYASRTAMTRAILGELSRGRASVLREVVDLASDYGPGAGTIKASEIAKAIDVGDDLATEVVTEASGYLALGLASTINLLNPRRIVLGGGVVESVDLMFRIASRKALQEALPAAAAGTGIVRAGLGDYSGVVGAALIGAGLA